MNNDLTFLCKQFRNEEFEMKLTRCASDIIWKLQKIPHRRDGGRTF